MFVLMRALTWSVLFIGFVLVFLPAQVLRRAGVASPAGFGPAQWIGGAVVVLGGALAVWCILTFALAGRGTPFPLDPPRRLVVSGPYAFVRNPMYWGALLALSGAALYNWSPGLFAYAAAFAAAVLLVVHGYEEPTLRRMFGAQYEAYCRDVPRWLPRRSRARAAGA